MKNIFHRSKSEGVDITVETIDIDDSLAEDTPKPVKKRGRRPKFKDELTNGSVSNDDTLQNDIECKELKNQNKCSSVENLIEMLENDEKDNDEGSSIDIEGIQKLIRPADIKQEAIHPDLDHLEDDIDDPGLGLIDEDDDDDDDEDDDDEDDSEYEEREDTKNCGESSNAKKSKVRKNSVKKKTPEILIPQMVS